MAWNDVLQPGYTIYPSKINEITRFIGTRNAQIPAKYLVYLDGSTYKAKNGDDGSIDYSGTVAATVIQAALDGLTSGRTSKERVALSGSFSLTAALTLPSWTILDLSQAKLTVANSTNIDILTNDDYPASGGCDDSEVWGGTIDGNRANQTGSGSIVFYGCNRVKVIGTKITNVYGTAMLARTSDDCVFAYLYIDNPGTDGVVVYDGSDRNLIYKCFVTGNDGSYSIQVLGAEVEGQSVSKDNEVILNTVTLSTAMGISIKDGGQNTLVALNKAYTCQNAGIELYSRTIGATTYQTKNNQVLGNMCYNNNQAAEALQRGNGISLYDDNTIATQENLVALNRCFDDQGGKTQEYGIGEGWTAAGTLTDYNVIANNNVRGNKDGGIRSDGANTQVRNNLGHATENSGMQTLVSGNLSAAVAHGLATTPSAITVSPVAHGASAPPKWWISSVDATDFNLKLSSTQGANMDFYWKVEI